MTVTGIPRARLQATLCTRFAMGSSFPFLLAILILTLGSAPALSAESKANVTGYCVQQFGTDAFANVDRRDNGLLCSVRTHGGLGLTHNKIKAADVCATQHGSRQFRREGQDVICLTGSDDNAGQTNRSIDLEQHCKKAHGPDAFPTVRRTDNKPMCTVRTDGGLGLRHHVVDTAGLCGGGASRVDGKTLHCDGPTAARPSDDTAGNKVPSSPPTGLEPDRTELIENHSPDSRGETIPVPSPSEIQNMICEGQPSSEARQWCYQHIQ